MWTDDYQTIQDFSQRQFLHGKLIVQVIKVYMLAIMLKNYDKEAENSGWNLSFNGSIFRGGAGDDGLAIN